RARRERGDVRDAWEGLGLVVLAQAGIAELPEVVGAPAVDLAVAGGRAGVRVAGRDRADVADRDDADRERARRARAVAQLPAIVAPPAPQAVVVANQAGVSAAGADRARGLRRPVSARGRHAAVGVVARVVNVATTGRRARSVDDGDAAMAVHLAVAEPRSERALRVVA